MEPGRRIVFEGHVLDPVARTLVAPDGRRLPVTGRALDVLVHLVEHRGRVVGKDELLAAAWPGRVVEENNLAHAVSALRHALGTGAGDHRFIVTVPGRGYRFVAPVVPDGMDDPASFVEPIAPPAPDGDVDVQVHGALPARPPRIAWGASARGLAGVLGLVVLVAFAGRFAAYSAPKPPPAIAGVPALASTHPREACPGGGPGANRLHAGARQLLERADPARIEQARARLERALAADPACAAAWASIARAHRLRVVFDHDPRVERPLAVAAVERALALDAGSPHALVQLGENRFWFDWDWAGAEAALRAAIAADPGLADAHVALADVLHYLGRNQEAAVHARRAHALDPASPWLNTRVAWVLFKAGFEDESAPLFDAVVAAEPDHWYALLSWALGQPDRVGAAERGASLAGRNARALLMLGMTYFAAGRHADGMATLRELERRADDNRFVPASALAHFHMALGDHEAALDLLERGYRQRDFGMATIRDWFWLQGNPRYRELKQRMRLEPGESPGAAPAPVLAEAGPPGPDVAAP